MAEALTNMGRFDECIVNANKAVEIDPKKLTAYLAKGFCELSQGNYIDAENTFLFYVRRESRNSCAWTKLGLARAGMLRYADAIKAYNRALIIDPTGCEALIARGDAWINIGDYEQALSDYEQAINLGDPRAYAGRGTAYYYLGMYDDALADLEFATQLPQNNSQSYCLLALTYFEFGRYQDILDAVSAATAIGPECGNYKIYEVVSQSYYELGQYEEGVSYITMIFDEKHTIFALGYYYRGIMYDSLGKNQEAIQDLAFFIRMGKSIDDSYPEQIADAKERLARLEP